MNKVFFLSLCFASITLSVQAHDRSLSEMKQIAAKTLKLPLPTRGAEDKLIVIDQNTELSVIGMKGKGFAVIAKDDLFDEVLGSTVEFTGEIAPACKWWMQAMEQSLQYMRANGIPMVKVAPAHSEKRSVEPLLTTTWSQEEPYNNNTPEYYINGDPSKGVHYVTGCVATAMAQVMKYHNYPEKGEGSKSYRFVPEGGTSIRISANFGNTTYDWAHMKDTYKNGYTETEAAAVATLMHNCGVSVNMQYTKDGSGAFSREACLALRNNFRYNKNIKMLSRDYYNIEEWMQIIYKELDDSCPILYGGATSAGAGHAFVLDGYTADGKVYVNWGWNGSSNGIYDIANLRGYNEGQDLIQVRLPDDNRIALNYYSIWGLAGDLRVSKSSATSFKVTSGNLYNFDVETFDGNIGVVIESLSDPSVQFVGGLTRVTSEYLNGMSGINTIVDVAELNIPDGEYRVFLASKSTAADKAELKWNPVRCKESVNNSALLTISSGRLTVSNENNSSWTGVKFVPLSAPASGMVRVYTLQGQLVYAAQEVSFCMDDVPGHGVLIVKDASGVHKVTK